MHVIPHHPLLDRKSSVSASGRRGEAKHSFRSENEADSWAAASPVRMHGRSHLSAGEAERAIGREVGTFELRDQPWRMGNPDEG